MTEENRKKEIHIRAIWRKASTERPACAKGASGTVGAEADMAEDVRYVPRLRWASRQALAGGNRTAS